MRHSRRVRRGAPAQQYRNGGLILCFAVSGLKSDGPGRRQGRRLFGGGRELVHVLQEQGERPDLLVAQRHVVLELPDANRPVDVPRRHLPRHHALADGLMCFEDKRLASSEISTESRTLAAQMFRAPVDSFAGMPWPKAQGADLRKFLIQILQRHIEKKLVTAGMLEKGGF